MEVVIPVTPLSRKILLSEYGGEPIRISNHDLLFQQLSYTRVLNQSNLKRLNKILTTTIRIKVHNALARKMRNHLHQLGYHLYSYHCQQMMRWVEAQVNVPGEKKVNAKQALINFSQMHNINEDDFELDSAYKRWVRHKRKKLEINPRFFQKNISSLAPQKFQKKKRYYG